MAEDTYPGVMTDEDEELKGKRLNFPPVKYDKPTASGSMPAPMPVSAATSDMPASMPGVLPGGPNQYAAPKPSPNTMPPAMPLPESAAQVSNYPAPTAPPPARPAALTAEELKATEPHGLRKGLGALFAGMGAFRSPELGQEIYKQEFEAPRAKAEQQRAGEQQAYDVQLAQGEKERTESSEAALKAAQTEKERAQAGAVGKMVTVQGPNGPVEMPVTTWEKLEQERMKQTGAGERTAATVAGREKTAGVREPIRVMGNETYEKQQDGSWKVIGPAPPRAEAGNYMPVNDETGSTTAWVDPKSGHLIRVDEIPGMTGEKGVAPTGAIPPKPNPLEKRMADMAQYSTSLMDDATEMINNAKDQLGPGAGRWNEFVAGKVGLKNVDWTGINAQLTFVTGALTLAHSQGRVSNLIMEQFQKMLDAGKQDPDNLLKALDIAKKAMGHVAGQFAGGGAEKKPGGEAGGNEFKAPAGAPVAPKEDGKVLKKDGKILAISKGGVWQAPPATQ